MEHSQSLTRPEKHPVIHGANHPIVALCAAFVLPACTHSPSPPIGPPAACSPNYDFVAPSEIAKKGRPVWILPKTTMGWAKGGVDRRTGDWHSGEYVGTIVEPGHWATLEEAELGTQPYIIAGENQPIVPEQTRAAPSTATSATSNVEIDSRKDAIQRPQSRDESSAAREIETANAPSGEISASRPL